MMNAVIPAESDLSMSGLDAKIIDLIPAAVYICAASGVIVRYNHRAVELWGREPRLNDTSERFCGSYRIYSLDGELIPHDQCSMAYTLQTGIAVRDKEAIVERPDGTRITAQVNIDAILDEDGKIIGAVNVFRDITQRKQMESTLRQSELWFRRLMGNLPAAAYTCDRDGLITYYNQRAVELWGREPQLNDPVDRFCGSYRLYALDGSPISHDRCWMALALEDNSDYNGREIIIQTPDGRRIPALAYANPLHDEAGNLIGAMNVLVDITERNLLEEESRRLMQKLRNERERLKETFEYSPAFMAVLRGRDHVFESVNRRCYELLGERDIVGKPLREALPEIVDQGYQKILDQVYETGERFMDTDMPMSIYHQTHGQIEAKRVEIVYEPLRSPTGTVTGILVHGLDLTERKQAEERLASLTTESDRLRRLYETILANVPDLVYVFDLNGRFTYANEALLAMWGKTWEQAIGKNCLELGYPAWHAAKHDRELQTVISTRKPIRDEVPFIGANGLRIYDYIFVPVMGDDGEVEAIAGTTRDVTDRKKMEQELQTRAEELAETDRKKDEFIALLAHELRNPLAPVRNGLRILELSEGDVETMVTVRAMMDRQLTHMVRLIDDLLDVSRMNRNKLHLQKTRVTLEDVVSNAVEAVRPAIDASGHQLSVSLPEQPIFLDADLTRLAQVFSNLLSNSCKYTPPGGQIWLTATVVDDELQVVVRDTGSGIPANALPNVFDMFSQVSSTADQASGGLGIGLALVKALVEMHRGRVSASSDGLDQGATFTVVLPILKVEADSKKAVADNTVSLPPSVKRRVLVVDDNLDSCDSMAMILQILGHEVGLAHDGVEAVAMVETFQPEIVLMDIGMPLLNGYEATRRIREHPWGKNVAIIALTGWGQEGDRAESRAAGCNGHLVKPVNLKDIEQLLADLTVGEEKLQIYGDTTM